MEPEDPKKKKKEEEAEVAKPEKAPPQEVTPPEGDVHGADSLQTQPAIVVSKEAPTAPVPTMAVEPASEVKALPQNKNEVSTCPTCGRPKTGAECYYCSRQKSKRPRMFED